MRTTTMAGVVTSTAEGATLPVTVDTKGRVRISKEQRGLILEDFERSGIVTNLIPIVLLPEVPL